jgi:glycosyltransferase involved in cell wall biosynthesis
MAGLSGCIVVRNGKSSVVRCLDALLPLVNEYVIVDTGSTDGTVELVADWKKQHPGSRVVMETVGNLFHDEDGIFDFGGAKNYAIKMATCPYVMWLDVNDTVVNAPKVRDAFDKIVNKIPHASITLLTRVDVSFAFPRVRIAPKEFAHFEGRIHEYMVNTASDGQVVTTRFMIDNFKKYRDVSRNVKTLMKDWKLQHTQRSAFYLGNSARDINDFDTASAWYEVTVDEFPSMLNEERAKSMEALCDIALRRNDLVTMGFRSMQMIEELPNRPEGYYYRAKYQYAVGNYSMAAKCLDKLLKVNRVIRPSHMWINPEIYDRHRHIEMYNEAMKKAEYSNMQPMMPERVENYRQGRSYTASGFASGMMGGVGTPMYEFSN